MVAVRAPAAKHGGLGASHRCGRAGRGRCRWRERGEADAAPSTAKWLNFLLSKSASSNISSKSRPRWKGNRHPRPSVCVGNLPHCHWYLGFVCSVPHGQSLHADSFCCQKTHCDRSGDPRSSEQIAAQSKEAESSLPCPTAVANFAPRSRTMARAFLLCCCVLVVSSAVVKDVASGGGTSPRCETVYDPVLTPPRACSCALRPTSRIWFRGRRCLLPQGHGAFAPWRIQALRGPPRMLRSRRSTCAGRNGVLPARRSIVRVAMTAAHPTLAIARL